MEPDNQKGRGIADKKTVEGFTAWVQVANFPNHAFVCCGFQ